MKTKSQLREKQADKMKEIWDKGYEEEEKEEPRGYDTWPVQQGHQKESHERGAEGQLEYDDG